VFSSHKWYHNHGALGVYGPDGMMYSWYDVPVGRHNDKFFLRESQVNSVMAQIHLHLHLDILYWIYTDKGFDDDVHIRAAYHGARLSPLQTHQNWIMSGERVTVEWGFGKVQQRCPFVCKRNLLKLQLVDVARYIRVAVLLTNAHTCMHQSQTGLYFQCRAPTLEEYFSW
jgi:hypothetical protein